MARRSAQPLYQGIVDDLKHRIGRRELTAGDRLLSIGEMSRTYNVSAITAKRAVSELQAGGWVHSIKGKGTFVARRVDSQAAASGAARPRAAVKTVVLVTSSAEALRVRGFIGEIWESVEQAAMQRKAGFRAQVISSTISEAHLDLLLRPAPGEGFVLLAVGPTHRTLAYLQDHGAAAALVDAVAIQAHSVASDNFEGMRQLIDYLRGLGHQRLHLVAWDVSASNATNENERVAAFQLLCADRKLEGSVGEQQTPQQLLQYLKPRANRQTAPTALLFTRDVSAAEFIVEARQRGVSVPGNVSVCGFDHWLGRGRELDGLTTYEVDRAELGRAAVDLLLRPDLPAPPRCLCVRVPGRLIIGDTTGPARQ